MIYYLLIFLLFAVFMFWMQRKQRLAQSKVESMQRSLQVGDQVVTMSGMYGTVVDIDDTTVDLEIAEDVVTTWLRQSIREVRNTTVDDGSSADDPTEAAVEVDEQSTGGDVASLTAADHRNTTAESDRD